MLPQGKVAYLDDEQAAADAAASGASDVLDDLAEATLPTGGEVLVLPAGRRPSKTGAAAIFRYHLRSRSSRPD